jgi:dTDP-glucose 4,6-dehydratase/UDP-glucose 4-epimerase
MKILVIGAKGFIGSNLYKHFQYLKFDVLGCDAYFDVKNHDDRIMNISVMSTEFSELVKSYKPNFCINAAGSGNVGFSFKKPMLDFEMNVNLVATLLNVIRLNASSCKVLHFSSAAVYGNPQYLPINENTPCAPISPYGFHKWMSELICKEFHSLYGLKTLIVRPFSVYGEGLRKQILWDMCNRCHDQKEIVLFGNGTETRDFIHISDLCRSIEVLLINSKFESDVYNLGNGNSVEIQEIADRIFVRFPESNISFNQQVKEGDPLYWKSDISKLKSLGYLSHISLENGINSYVDWFLNTLND